MAGAEASWPPAAARALQAETEFLELVRRLPVVRAGRERKVGLDHLDNLCKLMEQLAELREANVKLRRRVQYLEDVKSLHEMHEELLSAAPEPLTRSASAHLPQAAPAAVHKSNTVADMSLARDRSRSVGHPYGKGKKRASRWSRIKETLGWERTGQATERRDIFHEGDVTVLLSDVIPLEGGWCSRLDQSSMDAIRGEQDSRDSREPAGKVLERQKKVPKSPWGRVKTMIQTRRDSRQQKSESSTSSSRGHKEKSDAEGAGGGERDSKRSRRHAQEDKKSVQSLSECPLATPKLSQSSLKKDKGWSEGGKRRQKPRPLSLMPAPLDSSVSRSYSAIDAGQSKPSSYSPPFHRKSRWTRVKHVLTGKRPDVGRLSQSVPSSPASTNDGTAFDFDDFPVTGEEECRTHRKGEPLRRNLSQDFSRKPGRKAGVKQSLKDLGWLDKELQKVDREVRRLAKERHKFAKRAFRLQRLREALRTGDKTDVLVRTAAGEFRFEGISDAFTKKLYEWEAKRGVGPELSTIALLDESLRNRASEPDWGNVTPPSSKSSPSTSQEASLRTARSRASSEPDLSSFGTQKEGVMHPRSQSGDFLSIPASLVRSDAGKEAADAPRTGDDDLRSSQDPLHSDDHYYGLLEENLFLMEQLKAKEDLCRRLQGELESLDNHVEETRKNHRDHAGEFQMWEIESGPHDFPSALRYISELKSRLEDLETCADRLRADREAVEDSFRFHRDLQTKLTDDLIDKMRELQETVGSEGLPGRKDRPGMRCDAGCVAKIQSLSTQLLQQAREMEQKLLDKTRQVSQLQWELLYRDVSSMLRQAGLCPSRRRRCGLRHTQSWPTGEGPKDRTEETPSESLIQGPLPTSTYTHLPKMDYEPSQFITTVHELKKEILEMASLAEWSSDAEDRKSEAIPGSLESEMADESERFYDTGSAINSRSSSMSSDPSCRGPPSDCALYDRSKVFVRRNSSSNVSSLDGSEGSEQWRQWRSPDTMSTSSGSSGLEEETFTSAPWGLDAALWARELQLRYVGQQESPSPRVPCVPEMSDEHGDKDSSSDRQETDVRPGAGVSSTEGRRSPETGRPFLHRSPHTVWKVSCPGSVPKSTASCPPLPEGNPGPPPPQKTQEGPFPELSPSSRARSVAIQKAKEEFLLKTNVVPILPLGTVTPPNVPLAVHQEGVRPVSASSEKGANDSTPSVSTSPSPALPPRLDKVKGSAINTFCKQSLLISLSRSVVQPDLPSSPPPELTKPKGPWLFKTK